jgi:hypothetical protein
MKPFLSKYLFPLAALAALIAFLLCHFQEKRCTDPITTYEILSNGIIIEPDSTIAGATQVKVKVAPLDSLGVTLADTVIALGAPLFVPVPINVKVVRIGQSYINGSGETVAIENENLKTAGIIIGVDVVIRPITELPDYADEFTDCCSLNVLPFYSAQLTAFSPLTFNWDGFVTPAVNVMKVTVQSNSGATVTFIVIYDTSIAGSKPMIFGPCDSGTGTGFSNCDANMTTMYSAPGLNFSIRFFKINSTDMQVEIMPQNDGVISAYSCTDAG